MKSHSLKKGDFFLLSESEALEAYKYYSEAMSRRRPESVLSEERFLNHVLNNSDCYIYTDNKGKKSYIFGKYYAGIFHPSHFAPSSNRAGVDLIRKLLDYDNILFSVTDDLSGMLEKIGYFKANKSIPSFFNGEIVMKDLYASSLDLKNIVDLSLVDVYKRISSFENPCKCLDELINSFENNRKKHFFMEKWFGVQDSIKKRVSFFNEKSCYNDDYAFSQDFYFRLSKNKLREEN